MATSLADKLLASEVFESGGQHTMRAYLAKHDLQKMNRVYDSILDQVEDFIHRKQQED